MSRTIRIRLLTLFLCASAAAFAYHHSAGEAMRATAVAFVTALDGEQADIASFDFNAKERTEFHFIPDNNFAERMGYPRPGLTYQRMQGHQRHLADALLATGLSSTGFVKAKTIMSFEDILRIQEADLTGRRDPLKYYFSVYGDPSNEGAWGWRAEGHHLSLHFTVKDGELVASSPTFFGTNPNLVLDGPRKGLEPLKLESEMAFAFFASLSSRQKSQALVAAEAYPEMLTAADSRAALKDQPTGLAASDMTDEQYAAINDLIALYANNVTAEAAAKRIATAEATAREDLHFAWAGADEARKGHYFRIQTPEFLIEHDNTQNDANHIHSIWRDYDGDFGRDLLSEHYKQFDHSAVAAD
jgi:hypothetical protein